MVGLTGTKHEQGGYNGLDLFGYRTVRDSRGMIARPHRPRQTVYHRGASIRPGSTS